MRTVDAFFADEPWRPDAACLGLDTNLFFPEGGGDKGGTAIAICGRCPVASECGASALARDEKHGVWGGLTAPERRALAAQQVRTDRRPAANRARAQRPECGTPGGYDWHIRHDEDADPACKAAHAEKARRQRAAASARKAAEKAARAAA